MAETLRQKIDQSGSEQLDELAWAWERGQLVPCDEVEELIADGLRCGYDLGFFNTSEGYNGEYPSVESDDEEYMEAKEIELADALNEAAKFRDRLKVEKLSSCNRCGGVGWLEPIGPKEDGSYITSRPCPNCT